MADLTQAFDIGGPKAGDDVSIAVAAVVVYAGGAAGIIGGTGYARKLLYNDQSYTFLGVFLGTVDNSAGSAGDKRVTIARRGVFKFNQSGLVQADVGKRVWFSDDNTVTTTPGTHLCGVIETIESSSAWVRITPPMQRAGRKQKTVTTVTATGATTLTAAQVLGGQFVYSGNGAATHTLPTGTLLSAAFPDANIGDIVEFECRNTGNNTLTIAVGTDITSVAGNTLTVATLSTRLFRLINTGATTWDLYSVAVSLH